MPTPQPAYPTQRAFVVQIHGDIQRRGFGEER